MHFRIFNDGTININAGDISINGIHPYVNDKPFCAASVNVNDLQVRYGAPGCSITLSVRNERDYVVLSTVIEGLDGVHDIEPVGRAVITGAEKARYQGPGMEGPSGFRHIDNKQIRSHGIIGLSGKSSSMVLFTADHRYFSSAFSAERSEGLWSDEYVLSAGISLECTTKDRVELPDLYFISGDKLETCMTRAASMIASEMGARTCMDPGFHWCSWYYHYENMSQTALETMLHTADEQAGCLPDFNYIQLDAGYTSHIGDWLDFNQRYPEGLGKAAETITDRGFEAGIWIAPFMAGDESRLYREHPDWVLHEKDGSPYVRFRSYTEPKIWGNTDNDYYVIDITHPEASAYIRSVFAKLREWGFTLYKIDFILWGMIDSSKVIRYDNSKTSVMILREMLAMIREVIGEESYLLCSIAPFMPCLGYADGMRIASDMGAQWTEGAFGPANLLQELPYDNYFNNIYWQNDPDSVILRDFATHLTEEETWSVALLQALSGGIITTSDPVQKLSESRRKLLEFIKPDKRVSAGMPFLTDGREEIVITHQLPDWNLLYVLNPTGHPLKVDIRTDALFGTEALFQYRFDRSDETGVVSEKSSCFSDILAPHGSALLFITEEPLTVKPSNLWCRK